MKMQSDFQQQSFDFIIIGAGITGINAAYRISQYFPRATYTILDRRHEIGGTWSFFKYPGIRSDSDLYTMGFKWKPWTKSDPIADGPGIAKYVQEAAADRGIDQHVQYDHEVVSLDWCSSRHIWKVHAISDGRDKLSEARFVIAGTGFFDYKASRTTTIPGIENFQGPVAHPQFWPENLDYANKKVVVIGSGATAVTMVPIIAKKAAKTVMLQRSPTYIMSLAGYSSLDTWIRRILPQRLAWKVIAWRFTIMAWLFFYFTQLFPVKAREVLKQLTTKELPKGMAYDPNFNPKYNVWDQRLCVCPDGDFFRAMDDGKAEVVTAGIEAVENDGIRLQNGEKVEADILATATGLKLQMLGGAMISVNGKQINIGEQFMWRGTMLEEIPNFIMVIGYWNNSWTLGSDLATQIFLKTVKEMQRRRCTSFKPVLSASEKTGLTRMPLWNMSSTYLQNDIYPRASTTAPWNMKDNYMRDWFVMRFGDLQKGLQFEMVEKP